VLGYLAPRTGDVAPARERLSALLASFDEGAGTARIRGAREMLA